MIHEIMVGSVYDGDWINDNKEGSGKMTYDNSNIYAQNLMMFIRSNVSR